VEQTQRKNMLDDRVIQLHDIARHIETECGTGALSSDVRAFADRLSILLSTRIDS
jgi:hypothetical protein